MSTIFKGAMNTASIDIDSIVDRIKNLHPKLYVTIMVQNDMRLGPEKDDGYIEYKRTLINCNDKKIQQYATQMRWRITENIKHQRATYYIGVDDNGTIIGLTDEEIIECIRKFILIANTINASIFNTEIIQINTNFIIRIGVKIKKIHFIEFDDDNF